MKSLRILQKQIDLVINLLHARPRAVFFFTALCTSRAPDNADARTSAVGIGICRQNHASDPPLPFAQRPQGHRSAGVFAAFFYAVSHRRRNRISQQRYRVLAARSPPASACGCGFSNPPTAILSHRARPILRTEQISADEANCSDRNRDSPPAPAPSRHPAEHPTGRDSTLPPPVAAPLSDSRPAR